MLPAQGKGEQRPDHGKAFHGLAMFSYQKKKKKKSLTLWTSPSQLAIRHLGPVGNLLFRTKDQTTRKGSLTSRPSFLHKTPQVLQKNSLFPEGLLLQF